MDQYTYLLANPQKITSADLDELDALVQKYPYFQSARALQLKGLKNQESYRYNEALRVTAAHTADRDILFEYITSEKFAQNEISQTILQHDTSVMEIEVVAENVTQQLAVEADDLLHIEKQKAEAILNPDLFQRKVNSVANLVENEKSQNTEGGDNAPTVNPDEPLQFTKSDTHSFFEWLKLTKAKPVVREEETSLVASKTSREEKESSEETSPVGEGSSMDKKERKFELIERFIQERPKIVPDAFTSSSEKKSSTTGDEKAKSPATAYTQAPDSLMTETLAKVYLQQKNYKKAIQAYKILILKNPEKSGFFADQIRAIEKLINPEAQ